ncbi:MAG: sigma-54-dependent Fis family transcriptional regulator [Spirochaetes bacterium GWF1_31_7]|nr:MAG: sigma-54-dependent Fis family transcriptional regulator [Spirochaetes bacterium GWE1_32_154]OHD46957.1 MAG: sigma-54-dependent Fis family transcriptional regulator [Spirochaetes bacterium GWF1_31_7]OHD49737.1 MAG: sigma-54-dependent Fis family transcriptional regulator [Spirochaetes bacterium GWE2_31_10]OHD80128.1 MAG: sigma-54-dependent Fis family transcriptional regulator [Spirochaetes bacterium RIFOXYB1_FULL_32_8]HBD95535.1 sigma-54-dependent Fis family transcriptional regulator [Spi
MLTNNCQNNGECYSILYTISKIIMDYPEVDEMLDMVLYTLMRQSDILRVMITIINTESNEIFIEKANGFSDGQVAGIRYTPGEGIIGNVIASGKSVVIEDVSKNIDFLNRTNSTFSEGQLSFLCVPINYHGQVVGALSVFYKFKKEDYLQGEFKSLSVIAFMISEVIQIIKLEREKEHELVHQLREENSRLKNQIEDKKRFHPENIIGTSKAMNEAFSLIEKVARTNTTVLIQGESGVGKELVAQAIHHSSLRSHKPFIKVNCAALPPDLIESELFGHVKGAFTGAIAHRTGRFEAADEGTIFLDEITEIPLNIQVKLLRVLQEREIERVGDGLTKKINVRIIAATNRDIPEQIRKNEFREDLYYRLNVFPLVIPPLRNRKSDILSLADFFVEKYSKMNNKVVRRISTPAIDMLTSYHWPGNVRELENCIERAVVLNGDGVIHSYHLPPTLQTGDASNTSYKGTLQQRVEQVEKEMIIDALKDSKGNMSEAAKQLEITERMIGLRMDRYKINYKIFRGQKND